MPVARTQTQTAVRRKSTRLSATEAPSIVDSEIGSDKESVDPEYEGVENGTKRKQGKRKDAGGSKRQRVSRKKPDTNISDPSTWPATMVPKSIVMLKGDARAKYRVHDEDFDGLVPIIKPTQRTLPNGRPIEAHWYREWEIERRAWTRYGGPNGFREYLDKLKARKRKMAEKEGKPLKFPEPFPYYTVDLLGIEVMRQNNKFQMALLQRHFPPWLWRELEEGVENWSSDVQVDMLKEAHRQKFWEQYPDRPDTTTPRSVSFEALESLLSRAPSHEHAYHQPNMLVTKDFEETPDYDWSLVYKQRVNAAVHAVELEHGTAGKQCALWLLYDTYARCICYRGINFVRSGYGPTAYWKDEALRVFRGPLQPSKYS